MCFTVRYKVVLKFLQDDFAMALMDLFLQKMEERVELTSRQARHSQSEQSLQMS